MLIFIIDNVCRAKAQRALCFAETYGLVTKSLAMTDANGEEMTIALAQDNHAGNSNCITEP